MKRIEGGPRTLTALGEATNGYATASIIDSERVVFNIAGNKYRLVVKVWFPGRTIWIKFVSTHKRYDDLDVRTL